MWLQFRFLPCKLLNLSKSLQEYTIHIAEPIYPDPQKTQAENVDAMRQKNAAVWKQIYEEFYGIPLVYDTAEAVQYVGKPTNIA